MGAALEALRRLRRETSPPPRARPLRDVLQAARTFYGGPAGTEETWLGALEEDLERLGWSPLWSAPLGKYLVFARNERTVPDFISKEWRVVTVEELGRMERGGNVHNVPVMSEVRP